MQQLLDVAGVLGVPVVPSPGHAVGPGVWSLQHQAALHGLQYLQGLVACQPQCPLHKLGVSIRDQTGHGGMTAQTPQEWAELHGKPVLISLTPAPQPLNSMWLKRSFGHSQSLPRAQGDSSYSTPWLAGRRKPEGTHRQRR